MPVSAADVLAPAFQHAREQLFAPFRFGQWTRLAVVGLLAGEMSSGGCNLNVPFNGGDSSRNELMAQAFPVNPLLMAAMITVLIALGIVLWLILLYINSMMRFVLFDSVIRKQCRIRHYWSQRRGPGFKYFIWQICFSLILISALAIVVGIPLVMAFSFGLLDNPRDHLVPLILGGVLLFFLVASLVILTLAVHVLTKDFVVPQMACEDITAVQGWRRLWPMMQGEKAGYAVYIVLKIALALAAAVILFVAMLIVLLVLLIPVGGAGVVAVLAGRAAGLSWNIFTIALAVVAGLVVLAVILFLAAMISVPAIVFFPAYSIHFFAARYTPLDALLHPPADLAAP